MVDFGARKACREAGEGVVIDQEQTQKYLVIRDATGARRLKGGLSSGDRWVLPQPRHAASGASISISLGVLSRFGPFDVECRLRDRIRGVLQDRRDGSGGAFSFRDYRKVLK